MYTAVERRTVLFCGCKQTADGPFCDGSHNDLTEEYATDGRPREQLLRETQEAPFDADGKALLDGGCFVRQHDRLHWQSFAGMLRAPVIEPQDGAEFLSQSTLRLAGKESEALHTPDAEVVLYGLEGSGSVTIGERHFPLHAAAGVLVRKGECFRLHRDDSGKPLSLLMTVCPGSAELQTATTMRPDFDGAFAERHAAYDEAQRKTMADRFYQVLIGEGRGSEEVSQFIGEVPQSKAAPHRHLYEEAIVILSGYGTLWTETRRAPVRAGDLIFLPAKQQHSLECEDPAGMKLAGHFYPAGEPNINY
jgi:quercetin dioxygenase-like cupin family protein